jgi:hypothetical protein
MSWNIFILERPSKTAAIGGRIIYQGIKCLASWMRALNLTWWDSAMVVLFIVPWMMIFLATDTDSTLMTPVEIMFTLHTSHIVVVGYQKLKSWLLHSALWTWSQPLPLWRLWCSSTNYNLLVFINGQNYCQLWWLARVDTAQEHTPRQLTILHFFTRRHLTTSSNYHNIKIWGDSLHDLMALGLHFTHCGCGCIVGHLYNCK